MNRLKLIAALVVPLIANACRTVSPSEALIRQPGPGRTVVRVTVPLQSLPKTFPLIRDMAQLSEVVYHRKGFELAPPAGWRLESDLSARAETMLAKDSPPKYHHRPAGKLEYEVYVSNITPSPKIAVIAFRGTDSKIDHYTNFRWLTLWIPYVKDQYEQAELIVPRLVAQIKSDIGEDTTIIATGHSLGGGLAQTAGYVACEDVDFVYAFDPSPVTRHRAAGSNCPDLRPVYRIYEDTEILALSRLPLRFAIGLSDTDPVIMEAKVHLLPGKLTGHSMRALAHAFRVAFP